MAGERQFLLSGEDAHAHALRLLHRGGPALDEGGLRQVELASDCLHARGVQTDGVHHHRKRIARQRRVAENIHDYIIEGPHAVDMPPD